MRVRIPPGALNAMPDKIAKCSRKHVVNEDNLQDLTDDELHQCVETLRRLAEQPELCLNETSAAAEAAGGAALLLRRLKKVRRKTSRRRDQEMVASAAIRQKRTEKEYGRYLPGQATAKETNANAQEANAKAQEANAKALEVGTLDRRRICYACKRPYLELHHFYDAMCPDCGDFQYAKRGHSADLAGRTMLVTGGRVKIGFQIALKLLRSGATVLATSRFPRDAAYRYSIEDDFHEWSQRLRIYSSDFRSLAAVNGMCELIASETDSLNGLINNAAQTIRRPPQYYRHLLEREAESLPALSRSAADLIAWGSRCNADAGDTGETQAMLASPDVGSPATSALMSQFPLIGSDQEFAADVFPTGKFDCDGQQVDARPLNSWTMPISEVSTAELLEVHAVNTFVPFVLIQRLESLLLNSPHQDRYVVNVNAMEGQLNTHMKTPRHPHTNMAKAGMNMVTRTCGEPFARRGIYMNSVDTGWVTNEFPLQRTRKMENEGFEPPLDEIDGASRVLDPIFQGVGGDEYVYGKFLKDYRETTW